MGRSDLLTGGLGTWVGVWLYSHPNLTTPFRQACGTDARGWVGLATRRAAGGLLLLDQRGCPGSLRACRGYWIGIDRLAGRASEACVCPQVCITRRRLAV
jgi:hypothetical protein